MPRRDNHDRIIQLARVAQGGQHAADLRIDIARRTAIAAREAFLIAGSSHVPLNATQEEPAVIFPRKRASASLSTGQAVRSSDWLCAAGRRNQTAALWRYSELLKPSEANSPSW